MLCLLVLFFILTYKGIHILIRYKKTETKYPKQQKQEFNKKYTQFRIRVALFWLAFIALCILGKFVFHLMSWCYFCCTYVFLITDRLFINVGCLLQNFSDPKKKVVICCCGCPCRGWDLLMINTPLLFALNCHELIQNIFIIISTILAVVTMIFWEKGKYHLVEVRKKCKKPCNLSLCREHKG